MNAGLIYYTVTFCVVKTQITKNIWLSAWIGQI